MICNSGRDEPISFRPPPFSYRQWKEEQFDRLAEHVRSIAMWSEFIV